MGYSPQCCKESDMAELTCSRNGEQAGMREARSISGSSTCFRMGQPFSAKIPSLYNFLRMLFLVRSEFNEWESNLSLPYLLTIFLNANKIR